MPLGHVREPCHQTNASVSHTGGEDTAERWPPSSDSSSSVSSFGRREHAQGQFECLSSCCDKKAHMHAKDQTAASHRLGTSIAQGRGRLSHEVPITPLASTCSQCSLARGVNASACSVYYMFILSTSTLLCTTDSLYSLVCDVDASVCSLAPGGQGRGAGGNGSLQCMCGQGHGAGSESSLQQICQIGRTHVVPGSEGACWNRKTGRSSRAVMAIRQAGGAGTRAVAGIGHTRDEKEVIIRQSKKKPVEICNQKKKQSDGERQRGWQCCCFQGTPDGLSCHKSKAASLSAAASKAPSMACTPAASSSSDPALLGSREMVLPATTAIAEAISSEH
eukprot:1161084-Pelagomonas_calceolata.AAC.8